MIDFPQPNGGNGDADRDERGRFRPGCAGGPGNSANKKTAALRRAMAEAVGPEDIKKVVAKLLELALAGDVRAIDSLLDRLVGKSVASDWLLRLERLENLNGVSDDEPLSTQSS